MFRKHPPFDHDYAEELVHRLSDLQKQGKDIQSLLIHFCMTLRYSRGLVDLPLNKTNRVLRTITKLLSFSGFIPIVDVFPTEIKDHEDKGLCDLNSFREELEIYLAQVTNDDLPCVSHPKLGPFTIDEWARWHVLHFEHHLQQLEKQTANPKN